MADRHFDQRVAAVRRFNRFYTRQIGLLQIAESPPCRRNRACFRLRVLEPSQHCIADHLVNIAAGAGDCIDHDCHRPIQETDHPLGFIRLGK